MGDLRRSNQPQRFQLIKQTGQRNWFDFQNLRQLNLADTLAAGDVNQHTRLRLSEGVVTAL